ncbi:hypothetical protein [Candidatus Alkanophaga liquidiphilum]
MLRKAFAIGAILTAVVIVAILLSGCVEKIMPPSISPTNSEAERKKPSESPNAYLKDIFPFSSSAPKPRIDTVPFALSELCTSYKHYYFPKLVIRNEGEAGYINVTVKLHFKPHYNWSGNVSASKVIYMDKNQIIGIRIKATRPRCIGRADYYSSGSKMELKYYPSLKRVTDDLLEPDDWRRALSGPSIDGVLEVDYDGCVRLFRKHALDREGWFYITVEAGEVTNSSMLTVEAMRNN